MSFVGQYDYVSEKTFLRSKSNFISKMRETSLLARWFEERFFAKTGFSLQENVALVTNTTISKLACNPNLYPQLLYWLMITFL